GDVIGLVALYLVLRLVFTGVHGVALELYLAGDDARDAPAHPPGFRVPAHVITDLVATLGHRRTSHHVKGSAHRYVPLAPTPQRRRTDAQYPAGGGRGGHQTISTTCRSTALKRPSLLGAPRLRSDLTRVA